MGVTKTDYMRGMQCPKMLWLDRHKKRLSLRKCRSGSMKGTGSEIR